MVFRASWFEVQIWVDFGSDSGVSGTAKTRVSRERGCKNHSFTDPGMWSLLGSILETIWGPKLGLKDHWESLGGPGVPTWVSKMEVSFGMVFVVPPGRLLFPRVGRGGPRKPD
jgi:hypothetical protein